MFTGHWEWLIVLMIALLLFGSRLPSVMRSMGKSIQEFKKGLHEADEEIASAGDEVDKATGSDASDLAG
jgi:sec-independent protein translocase protein TatA